MDDSEYDFEDWNDRFRRKLEVLIFYHPADINFLVAVMFQPPALPECLLPRNFALSPIERASLSYLSKIRQTGKGTEAFFIQTNLICIPCSDVNCEDDTSPVLDTPASMVSFSAATKTAYQTEVPVSNE